MTSIIREGMVKTRKPHSCGCCRRKIPVKTKCYSYTDVYDDIFTVHLCAFCCHWFFEIVSDYDEELFFKDLEVCLVEGDIFTQEQYDSAMADLSNIVEYKEEKE